MYRPHARRAPLKKMVPDLLRQKENVPKITCKTDVEAKSAQKPEGKCTFHHKKMAPLLLFQKMVPDSLRQKDKVLKSNRKNTHGS